MHFEKIRVIIREGLTNRKPLGSLVPGCANSSGMVKCVEKCEFFYFQNNRPNLETIPHFASRNLFRSPLHLSHTKSCSPFHTSAFAVPTCISGCTVDRGSRESPIPWWWDTRQAGWSWKSARMWSIWSQVGEKSNGKYCKAAFRPEIFWPCDHIQQLLVKNLARLAYSRL